MEKYKELKKSLFRIGLFVVGMIGLNYLGFHFGVDTKTLALHASLSIGGATIATHEVVHRFQFNNLTNRKLGVK